MVVHSAENLKDQERLLLENMEKTKEARGKEADGVRAVFGLLQDFMKQGIDDLEKHILAALSGTSEHNENDLPSWASEQFAPDGSHKGFCIVVSRRLIFPKTFRHLSTHAEIVGDGENVRVEMRYAGMCEGLPVFEKVRGLFSRSGKVLRIYKTQNRSEAAKNRWTDPEYRKQMVSSQKRAAKERWASPMYRKRRAEAMQNPEVREKISRANLYKEVSEETKKKQSEAAKRRWAKE